MHALLLQDQTHHKLLQQLQSVFDAEADTMLTAALIAYQALQPSNRHTHLLHLVWETDAFLVCSTKEAFKKKIGFLGADVQAERMTDAFLTHGVVMKPDEIKYHAPKADEAIEKLGLHSASSASEASCAPYTLQNHLCTAQSLLPSCAPCAFCQDH